MTILHAQSVIASGPAILEITVNSSENDFSAFVRAGSPAFPVGEIRVFLANGVVIGSTSTSTPAMTLGSGWAVSSPLMRVIVASGSARIVGKGGVGGQGAEVTNVPLGNSCGGGGGGGGGTQVGDGGDAVSPGADGNPGTATAGGSGGAASDGASSGGNRAASNGAAGGPALEAPGADDVIDLEPASGATLELWGGGGGGAGGRAIGSNGSNGGAGGAPTQAGSTDESTLGTGGSAGANTIGSGTVNEVGPGTIDTDGP